MKNTLILFLLCFNLSTLFSQNYVFDVERMGVDFNGICHNDNVVIAYGDGSIILYSTDKGQNWNQKQIANDSLTIQKMLSIGTEFYGIFKEGFVVKSIDNGKSWQVVKSVSNINFMDLTNNEDKLYILTDKKTIQVFDKNLTHLQDVSLDSSNSYSNIIYFKNKLYLQAGKGKLSEIDVENNFLQRIIDISSYGNYSFNFKSDSNYLYAQIDAGLYKTQNPNQIWIKEANSINTYNFFNNDIYDIVTATNYNWQVSWLDFYKIKENSRNKINTDSINRYLLYLYISQFEFLDLNTIIAVGTNKTIYLSTDAGKRWELKSNSNMIYRGTGGGGIKFWINKNIGFFSNTGQIFKTTNAGVTWLPQVFTDTLIKNIRYFDAFTIDSSGKGFAWTTDNYHILQDITKNITFVYTNDFGETFINKWQDDLSPNHGVSNGSDINIVLKDDKYYFSIVPIDGQYYKNNYSKIFEMNREFEILNTNRLDSISILQLFNSSDKNLSAIALEKRYPNSSGSFDSMSVWILKSLDNGKTWIKDYQCISEGEYPNINFIEYNQICFYTRKQIMITPDSSVFNTYIYIIDLKKKITKSIYTDSLQRNSCYILFKYNSNIYLKKGKNEIITSNNYLDQNPTWKPVTNFLNSNIHNWEIYGNLLNDNSTLYSSYSGYVSMNLILLNIFKLTPHSNTDVEILNEDSFYIWASPAYPNPANNFVQTQVFALDISNLELKDIDIFNLYGEKLNSYGNIVITSMSQNSLLLKWEFSNINSGIYFININHGNAIKTIPVIINR